MASDGAFFHSATSQHTYKPLRKSDFNCYPQLCKDEPKIAQKKEPYFSTDSILRDIFFPQKGCL
jgi:hypothetical protein